MSNPGTISRTYYSPSQPAGDLVNDSSPGPHFSEICGASVGLFVPLVGVKTELASGVLSPTEFIGDLHHGTWRSLENRRYRDMFAGSVLFRPRAYYCRVFPEPESEEAGDAFALALVQPRTTEHAAMSSRLEAVALGLLTGESGGLISPNRVPWTVTHRYTRLRLRTNRLRLYAWTMADDFVPLFERVDAGEHEEANETPVMTFNTRSLVLDDSLCEHTAMTMRLIDEHRIFERVPTLHEVARRYLRCSDPSQSRSMRLLDIITAFEIVFGRVSGKDQPGTMAKLKTLLQETELEVLDAQHFRTFRNAIAHGRTQDDSISVVFSQAEFAVRLFIVRAIEAVVKHNDALPPVAQSFGAVKEIVFAH
jgi:hypothetical protein